MKILFLILCLSLVNCGIKPSDRGTLKFFEVSKEDFSPLVNAKPAPLTPNLNLDKAIINDEYPFEIALYKDQKWFYHLKNLGTGFGTWKYENGKLMLHAERRIFDMYIDIVALTKGATDVAIRFVDRKGPKELLMTKINID